MCILSGCYYAAKIQGIGPVKALKFIKEHGSIEGKVGKVGKEEKEGK